MIAIFRSGRIGYFIRIAIISLIAFSLFFGIISALQKKTAPDTKEVVRVYHRNHISDSLLTRMHLVPFHQDEHRDDYLMTFKQFLFLQNQGVNLALVVDIVDSLSIPVYYQPYEKVVEWLQRITSRSSVCSMIQIGVSMAKQQPIWAVRISSRTADDKIPGALVTGLHHGLEGAGAGVCLSIINEICQNANSKIYRDWLQKIALWVVPVVNPDGYNLVVTEQVKFPWWRKNLRDNNGNGIFDPDYDGVDLNRNYDYQWSSGGEQEPSSWHYRGPSPFSELETQAIRNLVQQHHFVFGLSLHSHGEFILYPKTNRETVLQIANELAGFFGKKDGYGIYRVLPLNQASGQSSNWFFWRAGMLDYTIELATEDFPGEQETQRLTHNVLNALGYLIGILEQIKQCLPDSS